MISERKPFEITVRGFHIDVFGHVNNARFLEYLEEARWELLDEPIRGGFFEKRDLSFALVNININFRAEALVNDRLQVYTRVLKIGAKSVVVFHEIFKKDGGVLVVDSEVTLVLLNLKTKKAEMMDAELKSLFEKFI